MAIYQHMELQFRLSPEDAGDYDWFDHHNNLSCNQDEMDHARDVEIFDCGDLNKHNRHIAANTRLKASYGMNVQEYRDTWGTTFRADIKELKYAD